MRIYNWVVRNRHAHIVLATGLQQKGGFLIMVILISSTSSAPIEFLAVSRSLALLCKLLKSADALKHDRDQGKLIYLFKLR